MSRYHKLINPKKCVFETKMAYNWGQAGLLKNRTIHHWCSWTAVDQLIVLISHGAYSRGDLLRSVPFRTV